MGEISAGDMVAEHVLTVIIQAFFFGRLVDAIDGGAMGGHESACHRLIGQQHVFLDELMRHIVLDALDAKNLAVVIESDFVLGEIEIERAVFESMAADALRHLVGIVQESLDVGVRLGLECCKRLFVGKASFGADDCRIELGADHMTLCGKQELDALGEAVDVGLQRAEFIAQRLGQHGDDAVHEVGGVSALSGFDIQCAARSDVVRDICDVDPEFPLITALTLNADGVVKVFGVIGVDGDDVVAAAVNAVGTFIGTRLIVGA